MSTLDELVPWLREQIAGTRRIANAACGGNWMHSTWESVHPQRAMPHVKQRGAASIVAPELSDEVARHIALNDPRTVLAQCDAHEALVDAYGNAEARRASLVEAFTRDLRKIADLGPDEERRRYSEVSKAEGLASGYGMAVLMVASAYRHRPGYRREWTP